MVVPVVIARSVVTLALVASLEVATANVALAQPYPLKDTDSGVNSVVEALSGIPGLLDSNVKQRLSSGDSFMSLDGDDGTLARVPLDLKSGISLGVQEGALRVKLPDGDSAENGTPVDGGVVAYPTSDGFANAVNVTEDGMQLLTVINGPSAPSDFSYEIDLPPGGSIMLADDQGGALVLDSSQVPIGFFSAPWAIDAEGKSLPTSYIVEGGRLTQHVDHHGDDVAYPVVADPHYRWYWNGVVVTLNPDDMRKIGYGGPAVLSAMLAAPGFGWASYAAVLSASGWALWAINNGQCFWFWVSPSPWDPPSMGTYRCR